MVPDDNGYFKYSVFNVSYPYNSVSSYVNKNGGKVNAKLTSVTHRKVSNLFVAIPREYSERADFIRCTLWGKGADLAVEVKRNDYIKVSGRLMSRDVYVNGEETETVYEISVKEMEKLEDEE